MYLSCSTLCFDARTYPDLDDVFGRIEGLEFQAVDLAAFEDWQNVNPSVLIEEQRSAQSNYDQGLARYNQFRTRGRLTQTNVQVLNPALVPAQGSGTSKSRTLLLAALLGLLLGIAYAVIRELLDRRIRTQADAESMTGGNFLGTLPKS